MNRILKILLLILLVPFYWGIGSGCSGTTGGGPLGNFNGANPEGPGTPGAENRPSAQPTTLVTPTAAHKGEAYIVVQLSEDTDSFRALCSPFVKQFPKGDFARPTEVAVMAEESPQTSSDILPAVCGDNIIEHGENCDDKKGCCDPFHCMWKDADTECTDERGLQGRCNETGKCLPCFPNGQKGAYEECDDSLGCCNQRNCTYQPLTSTCKHESIAEGQCDDQHGCLATQWIHVILTTHHPSAKKVIDESIYGNSSVYVHNLNIGVCPFRGEWIIDFQFPIDGMGPFSPPSACTTNISVEGFSPSTGEKLFSSDLLQIHCPMENENNLVCKIPLPLKKGATPTTKTVKCEEFIPPYPYDAPNIIRVSGEPPIPPPQNEMGQ